MLIIIEGADKTGKTTLAKEISKKFGYEYYHFGPPGQNPAEEYAKFLINLKHDTVCDRFLYGEMVYGPLLRGKSLITHKQLQMLERMCHIHNALLIHACTPLGIVTERLREMGDDMITQEQNEKAYYAFEKILSLSGLKKLEFRGTYNVSYEKFINNNIKVLKEVTC